MQPQIRAVYVPRLWLHLLVIGLWRSLCTGSLVLLAKQAFGLCQFSQTQNTNNISKRFAIRVAERNLTSVKTKWRRTRSVWPMRLTYTAPVSQRPHPCISMTRRTATYGNTNKPKHSESVEVVDEGARRHGRCENGKHQVPPQSIEQARPPLCDRGDASRTRRTGRPTCRARNAQTPAETVSAQPRSCLGAAFRRCTGAHDEACW